MSLLLPTGKENNFTEYRPSKPVSNGSSVLQDPSKNVVEDSAHDTRGTSLIPSPTQESFLPSSNHQKYLTFSWYNGIEHFAKPVDGTRPSILRPITPWTSPSSYSRSSHDYSESDVASVSKTTYHQDTSPLKKKEINVEEESLLSEASRPFSNYSTPFRPMHTMKGRNVSTTPTKLERLGPRRRNNTKQVNDDVSEQAVFPRISYATVVSMGASKKPFPIRGLSSKHLTREEDNQEKQPEPHSDTSYKKLICDALSNNNISLAEEYLLSMILDSYSGKSVTPPTGYCYNRVISAYSREGNHEKAQAILEIMWEDYRRGNKHALPNKQCYTGVMKAWQNSNENYRAPIACEEILRKMYNLYEDTGDVNSKPDLYAFTVVFHCWANSHRDDAVHHAERIFREMMDRCASGERDLNPDNVCYSNLINVLINSNKDDNDFSVIERAEALFWEMVESHFQGNEKTEPTTRNFNTILAALSKSSSPEAAPRASDILQKWEKYVIDGQVSSKPDAYSYSLLLKCWINAPRDDAMKMLQSTVHHIQLVSESNDTSVRFREIKLFTPVIFAFIKNKCTQWAHQMLLHLSYSYIHMTSPHGDTEPEIKWFQSIATLWSRHDSDIAYAADQAENLLLCLEELSGFDKNIKPNVFVYNSVLFTYKNARQPRRAHALLNKMERRYKSQRMTGRWPAPNTTSYHAVMRAWKDTPHDKKQLDSIRWLELEYHKRFGRFPHL